MNEARRRTGADPRRGQEAAREDVQRLGRDERHRPVRNELSFRAVVALVGLGANLPEDAIYPHANVDADGKPLTGTNRYTIRFPQGPTPTPVRAFWSITMYNSKQFFVDNPLDRYAIGDRDKLKFNDDGSLRYTSRTNRRARTTSRTGCPPRRTRSTCSCGFTGRRRRSSTALGVRRRWCGASRTSRVLAHSEQRGVRKQSWRRQRQSGLDVLSSIRRRKLVPHARMPSRKSFDGVPVAPTFFRKKPFGQNVEGLLHLIFGSLRTAEQSSICFDLMQGISWPMG